MRTEPGSEAQLWPATRGEVVGAECQEAVGALSALGGWQDWPPTALPLAASVAWL